MTGSHHYLLLLLGVLIAACAAPTYAPCPVELDGPLPQDAFAQCQSVLVERYGSVVIADAASFRLQTDWLLSNNPPRESRATVFQDPQGLVVVVETRALAEPLFGLPQWSSVRGDAAAERELAAQLQAVLNPPR